MKLLSLLVFTLTLSFSALAADKKIDWSACKKEITESCANKKDDHETHECLEKLPKNKISKACAEMNAGLEAKFSDKHEKNTNINFYITWIPKVLHTLVTKSAFTSSVKAIL